MKKLLMVVLAVVMCCALFACSQAPATEAPASEAPSEAPASEAPAVSEAPASEAPAAGDTFKVAVSLPPAENAWQANFAEMIETKLNEDPQIEATIKSSTDAADQMNVLQTFKDDGSYDLIAALPVDGSQLTATIDEIYDAGIPVIVIDRNTESDKKTAFVAGDNYGCGTVAAEYVQDFFKDQDEVKYVNLRSYAGTPIDLDRFNGFNDVISKDPKFVNLGEADGEFNNTAGFEAMSNLLAAYDEIDFVYTHDDETTTGALTAIEQAGRDDIKLITGMGGTVTAMNEIKADDTAHKMTSAYLPGDVADAAYAAITQYLTTGNVDAETIAKSYPITKDNVDDVMGYAYE